MTTDHGTTAQQKATHTLDQSIHEVLIRAIPMRLPGLRFCTV
jgi:hypothetical protein